MKEKRLVQAALFLLFVAFSLIYAVFVDVQAESVKKNVADVLHKRGFVEQSSDASSTQQNTGSVGGSGAIENENGQQEEGTETESPSVPNTITNSTGSDSLLQDSKDSFLQEVLTTEKEHILSGTTLYYGSLDVLKTLGIRYQYILKDRQFPIYYAYIGNTAKEYNLREIAESVGAKTIEIYSQNDIINNLYFGNRVTIVTMPSQIDSIKNVFTQIGDDLWLIQDTTGNYKTHKKHIRSIFTNK